MILSSFEIEWQRQAMAHKAQAEAQAATPLHSAAEGQVGCEAESGTEAEEEARQRRAHLQHEVDPYPPDAPEVARADLGKRYTGAVDVPTGYPQPAQVSVEDFKRGPITGDHYSYGPGYDHLGPGAYPVPVSTGTVSAAAISRPLLTDGRSRACAAGGTEC